MPSTDPRRYERSRATGGGENTALVAVHAEREEEGVADNEILRVYMAPGASCGKYESGTYQIRLTAGSTVIGDYIRSARVSHRSVMVSQCADCLIWNPDVDTARGFAG